MKKLMNILFIGIGIDIIQVHCNEWIYKIYILFYLLMIINLIY
jgi:hypothetical protein